MIWEDYKRDFVDGAIQRNIFINHVAASDWQHLIEFLQKTQVKLTLYSDGRRIPLPADFQSILNQNNNPYHLTLQLDDILLSCYFETPEQIQFEFETSSINNEFKANAILRLMSTMGRVLNKSVTMVKPDIEKKLFEYKPGDSFEYFG